MLKKIIKNILDFLLRIIFWKKVYFYNHNRLDVMVFLVIPFKGKLILLEEEGHYSMASKIVDIGQKEKIIDSLRDVLSSKLFKDISFVRNIDILDFYRECVNRNGYRELKDCLFFKVDLVECFDEKSLLDGAKLINIDDLKVECFKNRFNLYDYRLLIRSVLNSGYYNERLEK